MEKSMANTEEKPQMEEQKLTYEQLNEACSQLYQQNQYLQNQLKQANLSNMFKRLDYLFKVLECEKVIKDSEFISSCVDEIKGALSVDSSEPEEKQ